MVELITLIKPRIRSPVFFSFSLNQCCHLKLAAISLMMSTTTTLPQNNWVWDFYVSQLNWHCGMRLLNNNGSCLQRRLCPHFAFNFTIDAIFTVQNAEISMNDGNRSEWIANDGMQINVNKFISFIGIKSILDARFSRNFDLSYRPILVFYQSLSIFTNSALDTRHSSSSTCRFLCWMLTIFHVLTDPRWRKKTETLQY